MMLLVVVAAAGNEDQWMSKFQLPGVRRRRPAMRNAAALSLYTIQIQTHI